ncbi:conserved hypothetical protein [Neospora caninum Liverpool]|uniref:Transmembrane protein n=1 Tax=Neospora caninum (strain Liverpool) TaxID=572307 RepID=F0VF89_NEOCL|nr:conserved hypothetical protein [Neospora caninum Liverpool]CBZ52383.1 conserved hypothetical protein [Neospora caninum Liverpool]CEL66354.1 TPA: hypothetical protein BN1204_021720 [Neospora caninum Liverpool]|eukprot:XP_003882415.1 conserved hypothetical protein [Neospora caninum Liverpool]
MGTATRSKETTRRGSMHKQLVCTASHSSATNSNVVLPLGHHLVMATKTTSNALNQEMRSPVDTLNPDRFSWWKCLAHPDEAADGLVTEGYARLQILLAYLLPEVTDVAEPVELHQLTTPREEGQKGEAASLSRAERRDFTVSNLMPSRGYVRVSLNGVPVYRSAVLDISPDAINETAAVVKGEKEEARLPNTIFNERIEIQIHQPYSVVRVELFNRDVTLGVIADDDLLGVFEMPVQLMIPFKVYDLEVEFPPQFLREENEDWISCQGLDSPFILGEKRLVSPDATAQLLQTKQIFDAEAAAAQASGLDGPEGSDGAETGDPAPRTLDAPVKREAREAAQESAEKVDAGNVDLLTCTVNVAAAAAASAPQVSGLRSSSFTIESRSTVIDDWEEKPRPPLLPEGYSCGPRLRCLFNLQVVGRTPKGRVGSEKKQGSWFSEMCALALPIIDSADEASLPPLNFRKFWHDAKRLKHLAWDCVLSGLAESVAAIPTWENPFVSACCLASVMVATTQPQTSFALIFLLMGVLCLMLSLTPLSNTREAAIAAASVLTDAKRKPPEAALDSDAQAEKAEPGKGAESQLSGQKPSSLQAFESQQQSDEATMEDSLLKSLLSSAVPQSFHVQLRRAHKRLLKVTAAILYAHEKLRQRREVVVGLLWLLSLLSFYRPDITGMALRFGCGGTAVLLLVHRMPVLSPCLRLAVVFLAYLRLWHQRRTRQHLVAAPVVPRAA